MKVSEILREDFDYSPYIPVFHRLMSDTFHEVVRDSDIDDPTAKVNEFFYALQEKIDNKILAPLLKQNPITIGQTPIRLLTVSFKPSFDRSVGQMSMGSMSAMVQKSLRNRYPGHQLPKGGADTIAQYIRSHSDFTGEGEFSIDTDSKNAFIKIDIHGSEVANYLFNADNQLIADASLKTLGNNILGKLMHEIKHFIQNSKVSKNLGHNAQVNKFYTGDPAKLTPQQKNKKYTTTQSGYWLNADEMDAWAANVAAEIKNVFGNDTHAMNQYMNNASKNQITYHNNVPVNTSLNHYRNQIFNPKYRVNVDRNKLWHRFIKDVYKDLQLHGGSK